MLEAQDIRLKLLVLRNELLVGFLCVDELLFCLSEKFMLAIKLNLLLANDPLEAVSLLAHRLGSLQLSLIEQLVQ